jgi:hypothetical protein
MAGLILVATGCVTIILATHEVMPEWMTTVFAILAIVSAGFASYFDCKRKLKIDELDKHVKHLIFMVDTLEKRVTNCEDRLDYENNRLVEMEHFIK